EVDFRRFGKSANLVCAAPSERNLVGVELEDLLLRKLLLELQSNDGFGELAAPVLIGVEPEHAGGLHAERGGALIFAAFANIDVRCLQNAAGVESRVLEEALVFGGSDRVHEHLREVAELDDAALLSRRPADGLDELRLELVLRSLGVVLQRHD